MNDSSEATHYQVELTSRQVLAGLAVLLVCLFAAFFAGVVIGRNAEASSAASELASVDEVARGGERYDFFSKTEGERAGLLERWPSNRHDDERRRHSDVRSK